MRNRLSLSSLAKSSLVLASLSVPLIAQPAASSSAGQPSNNPTQPDPQYPIPYAPPAVEAVKGTLDRILTRLGENAPIRLINSETKQEITDFSKPDSKATMDRGPEGKFAPISYPMGVCWSGLLATAEATGDKRYSDFVTKRFQFFADHYEKLKPWGTGRENPFRNFYKPGNLDACGAMGAGMARARRMGVGPDLKPVLDTWVDYVHTKQMRLEDGTFCRPGPYPKSIWLDDAYMSVPLLAEWGAVTKERKYFDDGAAQIEGFFKHLWREDKGLFTHAGYAGAGEAHPFYGWGRANGWFMVATVELLDLMPGDHPKRDTVIQILRAHARGVAERQSGTGLYHQMLDRPDSYLETSCTAMFAYSMAKGVNRGWLDKHAFAPAAIAAWNGLNTKVSADGKVNDVCVGTNYANDYVYYYARPAIDDIHGYGPVLLAGSEMIKLLKNEALPLNSGRNTANAVRVGD
jgi:rhamnogalacturonyl hydrolase YesR